MPCIMVTGAREVTFIPVTLLAILVVDRAVILTSVLIRILRESAYGADSGALAPEDFCRLTSGLELPKEKTVPIHREPSPPVRHPA